MAEAKNKVWLAQLRETVIDCIPTPVVLVLASPYLAGATAAAAIKFAHSQYQRAGLTTTIDILGENSVTAQQCDQAVQSYKLLLDEIHQQSLPVAIRAKQISVSLKPSTFSVIEPQTLLDDAYNRIESVVLHADKLGINITIEAEDHHWTDFQLQTYFSLVKKGYLNLGTVLQSRLLRTKEDIKNFDERMRVRLVIGIYNEPGAIALTDKEDMKQQLVEYGRNLAERGTYVEFATHDAHCIDQFIQQVLLPLRLPSSKFEFQFLKGVPRKMLQTQLTNGKYFSELAGKMQDPNNTYLSELAKSGAVVRLYVPFGNAKFAGSYCKRRLKESPSIVVYGLKNLLHWQ
jgi:proline dehydrogenase